MVLAKRGDEELVVIVDAEAPGCCSSSSHSSRSKCTLNAPIRSPSTDLKIFTTFIKFEINKKQQ